MDKVGVAAAYSDPLCVCTVYCIWRYWVPSHTANCAHSQRVRICCHNTDLFHVNGHDRIILEIFSQALYQAPWWWILCDPKTCWSTFKYFIILIVSTYYILCISWVIKCLIIIDIRCKHKDNWQLCSLITYKIYSCSAKITLRIYYKNTRNLHFCFVKKDLLSHFTHHCSCKSERF